MMSLTGLFGLVLLSVIFGTRSIESGLEERIETTLKNNGITEVEVRAEARDVLVVGEVPSEEVTRSLRAAAASCCWRCAAARSSRSSCCARCCSASSCRQAESPSR